MNKYKDIFISFFFLINNKVFSIFSIKLCSLCSFNKNKMKAEIMKMRIKYLLSMNTVKFIIEQVCSYILI